MEEEHLMPICDDENSIFDKHDSSMMIQVL
jgi:hypothetical protein